MFGKKIDEAVPTYNNRIRKLDYALIKIDYQGKQLGFLVREDNVCYKSDMVSNYVEIRLDDKNIDAEQFVKGVTSTFGDSTNIDYIQKEVEELAKIKNDYDRRLRALSVSMQN